MKKILLSAFVLLFGIQGAISQNVTFQNGRLDYQELTNPILIQSGDWDDFYEVFVPPFSVSINGMIQDTIYVFDNGIQLFNVMSGRGFYCIPYDEDFISIKEGRDFISTVSYQVMGTAPNRTIVFQYKNVGFYDTDYFEETDYVNFQITVHESNNQITYNYGSSVWNPKERDAEAVYVSLYLFEEDAFLAYNLQGASNNPRLVEDEDAFITPVPSTGTLFRFTINGFNVSVQNQDLIPHVALYPVPFDKQLNIEAKGISTYKLMGIEGKTHLTGTFTDRISLDVSDITNGVYILILETEHGTQSFKVIK